MRLTLHKHKAHKSGAHCLCLSAIALCMAGTLSGQQLVLPMDELSRTQMLRSDVHRQQGVHSGMQPIFTATIDGFDSRDLLYRDSLRTRSWVHRKMFDEHFAVIDQPGIQLAINPVVNFAGGSEIRREGWGERADNPLYINTRGISISGKLGDAVYVYTDVTENQARFPAYITHFVEETDVVMGSGRVKPFGEGGFDYSMASAFVGFDATRWLSMQAGHFKHFVGHGSRSLLLSDNAFNAPFAGYLIRLWGDRVQLRSNVALMQSLDRLPLGSTPESLFKRKYMSWNYLSIKPIPSFEIGFYEAVMWQHFEEGVGRVPFNFAALNPVIFTNTLALGLDDPRHNAMVGINAAWQFIDHLRFYGQYMLDRGGDAKGGYQVGTEAYGLWDRFDLRLEYNEVEAGSYAAANALQGFTHFNQPLAHPMGSGFAEVLGMLTYYHNRIWLRAEWVYAQLVEGERNPLSPIGTDILPPSNVWYQDYQVAYIFNERNQLQLYAGITDRRGQEAGQDRNNQFWYLGLRTWIHRTYRNF